MNYRIVHVFAVAAVGALVVASLVSAGPLNPPAGPIAPTNKTLAEVEPRTAVNATNTPGVNGGQVPSLFRITQPGSYYLTGNIAGVANKYGIDIAASGVTLDLNGFELVGGGGTPGGVSGVYTSVNGQTNVAVRNGTVRDWPGRGVNIGTVTNGRVVGVVAYNCQVGIQVGMNDTVSDCSAFQNIGGIQAAGGSRIENCTAFLNGSGISVGDGCLVADCTANQNTSVGITVGGGGSGTPTGSTVSNCTANSNASFGISCASTCVVRNNTCRDNGTASGGGGITTGSFGTHNRVEGNHCSGSLFRGMDVRAARNYIIRNTCSLPGPGGVNWFIGADNDVGPIQDHTGANRNPVLGFSGYTYIGDYYDNFSY